jgi:hypothetical protein
MGTCGSKDGGVDAGSVPKNGELKTVMKKVNPNNKVSGGSDSGSLSAALLCNQLFELWSRLAQCSLARQRTNAVFESRSLVQAKDYKFYAIGDRFRSLEEVSDGLREAGLESSQLVRNGGRDFRVSQGCYP